MRFNPFVSYTPTFQEPDIRNDDTVLHSGQHNQLADAQALREWVKETLACGEWKGALVVPSDVSISFDSRTLVGLTLL
jgi:hypothetical protein